MEVEHKSLYFNPIYIAKKLKVNSTITSPISEYNVSFFNSLYHYFRPSKLF